MFFLCQSDKEKHVRICEIFISPIFKLFRWIRWITSWLMEAPWLLVTAIEWALFGAPQDRHICQVRGGAPNSAPCNEGVKTTLNDLVYPDQTGFITGRYIAENTRLIFDVLHDFDFSNSNKNGLIMTIDYSKTFNTIEWNFINTRLKKFNFGDNLINMVKLLQKKFILQNRTKWIFLTKNNVGKRL